MPSRCGTSLQTSRAARASSHPRPCATSRSAREAIAPTRNWRPRRRTPAAVPACSKSRRNSINGEWGLRMTTLELKEFANRVRGEIAKVVVGQNDTVDLLLTALLSGGHVLLEGPPGTAKTLLAQSFAACLR